MVKLLKVKIMKLEKKNKELEEQLQQPIPQALLNPEQLTQKAVQLNNTAIKIQANWKGKFLNKRKINLF